MITAIADIGNPPNGDKYRSTVILPVTIIIPQLGPPTLKFPPTNYKTTVGEVLQIRIAPYSDPDIEDKVTFNEPNFGLANPFMTGKYPSYMVSPTQNDTDPGDYEVAFTLSDDNPDPKSTEYSFKITVLPLPPGKF